MAQQIKFPNPEVSADWKEWAHSITQTLQRFFGTIPSDNQVGSVVIWVSGESPPDSVLPSGANFSATDYPILARQIGATTVPTIAAPAGMMAGVIAR